MVFGTIWRDRDSDYLYVLVLYRNAFIGKMKLKIYALLTAASLQASAAMALASLTKANIIVQQTAAPLLNAAIKSAMPAKMLTPVQLIVLFKLLTNAATVLVIQMKV